MAGHIVKRWAVATGADGGPAGCPNVVDDCENTVFEGKTSGCASDGPEGQTDRRQLTWSEPQGDRTEQHLNKDLLQQVTIFCASVQNLGKQEVFATESLRRQIDYKKMEKTMTAKMEEGFRSEQQARQQAHGEIMEGLKNEENVRQKEEMKNLKISGSTVCSESSTGVGLGYKRWCWIIFTSTLAGMKPGQSKGLGRPGRWSRCGARKRPMCQR